MNQILKKHILLILLLSIVLSPGIGQAFLLPAEGNDIGRQTRFIEAQSELIIGNTEGAVKIYKDLLKKDVNDHEAAFFLGKTYLGTNDLANSIKYFSLALANYKDNPWYYIWAADAFLQNDQFDQAIITIEQLVERFPDEKPYYDRLEYLYQDSKQYQKQIELIDKMLNRFGFHKSDALAKVQALENNEQKKEAIELLSDLAERFPKDLFILNMLANNYQRNGQEEQALEVFKNILAINPNDSRANLAIVDASTRNAGTGAEKLLSMKDFFLNKNIDFDTHFSEILPYFQEGLQNLPESDARALEQVSTWLLTSHPDDPKALSLRADIMAQTGQNVEATEYYLRTIKVHPDNFMVWEQLLWSLKELHRWEELNQHADNASLYFPNKAVIYLLKGEAGYYLENPEEARFDLETCLSLAERDPVMKSNALGLLALIQCVYNSPLHKNSTFDQARQILEGNPNIDLFESICLLESNDLQGALASIEKAIVKVPEKPAYRVQQARILYALGQYNESLQSVLMLEDKTTYFPVFEWIARNYKQLNQAENAEKYTRLAQQYGAPDQNQIKN